MNKPIDEIKKILIDGNLRFINDKEINKDMIKMRKRLIKKQNPFVIIIGCSDSRVPPEMIFDCNLGDIFDIRVAGNVIDEDILESINYAVDEFDCSLILVLGHQNCGAVQMAIDNNIHNDITKKIREVIDNISPSRISSQQFYNEVIDKNIEYSVQIIKQHLSNIEVQGAKYIMDSGEVRWL